MKHFEGKNVILTGATGGIGSKVAKKLLKAGMKPFIVNKLTSYINRCQSRYAHLRSL